MQLLRAVQCIELVELPNIEECCGFGGTFAIKNADTSTAMLGDKVRSVLGTRSHAERITLITGRSSRLNSSRKARTSSSCHDPIPLGPINTATAGIFGICARRDDTRTRH